MAAANPAFRQQGISVQNVSNLNYVAVAASQTGQVLISQQSVGAIGDFLDHLLVIPATTGAGGISILDGTTSISVFVSGTLPSLIPFTIDLGANSVSGGWSVTTGANVSVVAVGKFS